MATTTVDYHTTFFVNLNLKRIHGEPMFECIWCIHKEVTQYGFVCFVKSPVLNKPSSNKLSLLWNHSTLRLCDPTIGRIQSAC